MIIEFLSKATFKCDCCGDYKMNGNKFKWTSIVTKEYLCDVCQKCAIREQFGTNYKKNQRYHKRIKKINKK